MNKEIMNKVRKTDYVSPSFTRDDIDKCSKKELKIVAKFYHDILKPIIEQRRQASKGDCSSERAWLESDAVDTEVLHNHTKIEQEITQIYTLIRQDDRYPLNDTRREENPLLILVKGTLLQAQKTAEKLTSFEAGCDYYYYVLEDEE